LIRKNRASTASINADRDSFARTAERSISFNTSQGCPPFPRLVREGGDFDFLSVETMLGKW
jgi:hypothetical protein